jgi:hypothetical protein
MQIGDGQAQAVENLGAGDDVNGAGGGGERLGVGPAVARLNDAQLAQTEIGHGPGGGADILAKLRIDENDARRRSGA